MKLGIGHLIFAIIFFLAFVLTMAWAYRKDKRVSLLHYKGAWKIILWVIAILALLMVYVKLFKK